VAAVSLTPPITRSARQARCGLSCIASTTTPCGEIRLSSEMLLRVYTMPTNSIIRTPSRIRTRSAPSTQKHAGSSGLANGCLSLHLPQAARAARNFELTARPNEYGATGIRSYFVNSTLLVRATVENRAATLGDPQAFPCENLGVQSMWAYSNRRSLRPCK
jgi:hypothetical protein